MTAGIPHGWQEEERTDLRIGRWRFYRAIDPTFSSSVSEQNIVVRDGERMTGRQGILALLTDVGAFDAPADRMDAVRLAEQIGHFVVEGTSMSSARVGLYRGRTPVVRREDDALVLEVTYDRDGAPWPMTITAWPSGDVSVRRG